MQEEWLSDKINWKFQRRSGSNLFLCVKYSFFLFREIIESLEPFWSMWVPLHRANWILTDSIICLVIGSLCALITLKEKSSWGFGLVWEPCEDFMWSHIQLVPSSRFWFLEHLFKDHCDVGLLLFLGSLMSPLYMFYV